MSGVTVVSVDGGSTAAVRYLQDDGSFTDTQTSALGIFVILDPAVPEVFEASQGGVVIGGGSVGAANGVVFTLIINA